MTYNRIFGLVLLVVGICFLYFGNQASKGLTDQAHKAFTGKFSDSTIWYFIAGAASIAAGVALTVRTR